MNFQSVEKLVYSKLILEIAIGVLKVSNAINIEFQVL